MRAAASASTGTPPASAMALMSLGVGLVMPRLSLLCLCTHINMIETERKGFSPDVDMIGRLGFPLTPMYLDKSRFYLSREQFCVEQPRSAANFARTYRGSRRVTSSTADRRRSSPAAAGS